MLLLGILLLGATGAFAGLLVSENRSGGPDYAVTMFGNDLGTVNTLGAFLAGIALTLVFCLGLALVTGGANHARRRKAELRRMRREAARNTDQPTGEPATEPIAAPPLEKRHRRVHIPGH
ncbi:hypothetical protein OG607_04605 [Streptomyces sp. NBC_01537]|uniref:hypothetical protein n=1 Tax=Streptomyces sp. NBC_01537 TaxID=2903896 RepID=UPI003868AD75